MTLRPFRPAVLALLVAACSAPAASGGSSAATGASPQAETTSSFDGSSSAEPVAPSMMPTSPTPPGTSEPAPPDPDARIPLRPAALAEALETTREARRAAVDDWVRSGGASEWPPPEEVELLVLHEQRIYRVLAARDRLAQRVLALLRPAVAREARPNVRAGGALYDHFSPVERLPDFRTRAPEPAQALHRLFVAAEERFGVDWEVLAAVMLIETRMGRIVSSSSAGAQGPMQFIPSTWAAYGLGGDVHDERDAVMGAANYLRASGAPNDYLRALHRYNPVDAYVTAVRGYATAMMRDPDLFFAYYNWQVFVRTTSGDVRLTGPGP